MATFIRFSLNFFHLFLAPSVSFYFQNKFLKFLRESQKLRKLMKSVKMSKNLIYLLLYHFMTLYIIILNIKGYLISQKYIHMHVCVCVNPQKI